MKPKKPKLDPGVFAHSASCQFHWHEGFCHGACLAINIATRFHSPREAKKYRHFFIKMFKPEWAWTIDFWMNYDDSACELPDDLVWERRMLALLLCAEMIKHP